MSNAMEEAVLLKIDHPSHTDKGRISVLSGGVSGLIVFFVISNLQPSVDLAGLAGVSFVVFCVVTFGIYRWSKSAQMAREAARQHAEREAHERNTTALISKMKRDAKP